VQGRELLTRHLQGEGGDGDAQDEVVVLDAVTTGPGRSPSGPFLFVWNHGQSRGRSLRGLTRTSSLPVGCLPSMECSPIGLRTVGT
jgi:hypothetical protein